MDAEIFEHGLRGGRFFDETFTHPKASAIDAPKHIEFDWEALRRALGEAKEELGDTDYTAMASVLHELLAWIIRGNRLHIVGRRAIALAWVVNPALFSDGPSAAKLARRVGVHKAMLSEDAANASRKFKMRNRAQQHGWNYKKGKGQK